MGEELAREIADIRVKLGQTEICLQNLMDRINRQDAMIDTVNKLALSVEKLAAGQEDIKCNIKSMRGDVDALKLKPVKRWESVIAAAISALVAYIVGRITGGN